MNPVFAQPINKPPLTSLALYISWLRRVFRQHAWVALAISIITLAFFAGIDYGDSLGGDDWMLFYRACQMHNSEVLDRPLSQFALLALCPIFKADPMPYQLAVIGFRAANAFFLYLLVWQISRQSLFAFACSITFSTFLVNDSFFYNSFLQQNDHIFSLHLVILALNAFVASLRSKALSPPQIIWLGLSLALASSALLVRESTLPVLFVIPILLVVFERDFSKFRLAALGLWIGMITIVALRYTFVVLSNDANYSRGTLLDFDLIRMLMASKNQFDFAFRPVTRLTVTDIYQFRLAVFISVGSVLIAILFLRRYLLDDENEITLRRRLLFSATWTGMGLLASWLGFALFLPTIYAASPIRTHTLAVAGESVALAGVIWLVSQATSRRRLRFLLQISGLIWATAYGTVLVNKSQQEMYTFAATWDNTAYFMRSLGQLAPAVESPTLFVYIENQQTEETPFIAGFSFQYAVRHFYGDTATGLILTDNILGDWSVSDAGIFMTETWIEQPYSYGWDKVIVFTRETSGHLVILDKLPERFLTAYRQSLYRPLDRIIPAFIPQRIRETFPILSGPDWTGENYLLQNQ